MSRKKRDPDTTVTKTTERKNTTDGYTIRIVTTTKHHYGILDRIIDLFS